MRAQSIVSAFSVILGNFALHVTLAIMSFAVEVPKKVEVDSLNVRPSDDQCVSATELERSLNFFFRVHCWTAGILFYISIHRWIWVKVYGYFFDNQCCGLKPDKLIITAETRDKFSKYVEHLNRAHDELLNEPPQEMLKAEGKELIKEGTLKRVSTYVERKSAVMTRKSQLNLDTYLKKGQEQLDAKKEEEEMFQSVAGLELRPDLLSLNVKSATPQKAPDNADKLTNKDEDEEPNMAEPQAKPSALTQIEEEKKPGTQSVFPNQGEDLTEPELDIEQVPGEKDELKGLIDKITDKSNFQVFVNARSYMWVIFQVPLLLLYLVVVSKSAEITVLCRDLTNALVDDRQIALFVFFEIEVFAFFGVVCGLFGWLMLKYILNALFSNGPKHYFKTTGVKSAKDILLRNKTDVTIFVGVLWPFAVNLYMTSSLNPSRDRMPQEQIDLLDHLWYQNLIQFAIFAWLKTYTQKPVLNQEERLQRKNNSNTVIDKIDEIASVGDTKKADAEKAAIKVIKDQVKKVKVDKQRSICEKVSMRCVSSSVRSFFLLVPMIGGFIVYPFYIFATALQNELATDEASTTATESSEETSSSARLLQEAATAVASATNSTVAATTGSIDELEKKLEDIDLIKIWIFSLIIIMFFFTFLYIYPLMWKLARQAFCKLEPKVHKKKLGGFSAEDSRRKLAMRESIFCISFTANMSHEELRELEVPESALPSAIERIEINVTMLFCAFSQGFISWLLLQAFLELNEEAAKENASQAILPQLESNSIILVKFICAVLIHFQFGQEIREALSMMKYVCAHWEKFDWPFSAYVSGQLNCLVILFVEGVNLWNLANITDGTYDIIFDFIALGIIADFDDYFCKLYVNTSSSPLIGLEMVFSSFRTPKRNLMSKLEEKRQKLAHDIVSDLKDIKILLKTNQMLTPDEKKELQELKKQKNNDQRSSDDCCCSFRQCARICREGCCEPIKACFTEQCNCCDFSSCQCSVGLSKQQKTLTQVQILFSRVVTNVVKFMRYSTLVTQEKAREKWNNDMEAKKEDELYADENPVDEEPQEDDSPTRKAPVQQLALKRGLLSVFNEKMMDLEKEVNNEAENLKATSDEAKRGATEKKIKEAIIEVSENFGHIMNEDFKTIINTYEHLPNLSDSPGKKQVQEGCIKIKEHYRDFYINTGNKLINEMRHFKHLQQYMDSIKAHKWDKSCVAGFCDVLYRLNRFIYITLYFYLVPFFILVFHSIQLYSGELYDEYKASKLAEANAAAAALITASPST